MQGSRGGVRGRGLLFTALAAPALAVALAAASPASVQADPPRRHAAYVELLGKGSLWGLGYDYQPSPWLSVGAVGSYYILRGEHITSFSPYAGLYLLGHDRHRLLAQVGPMLVHKDTPAPVPELPGRSDTGVAGELSLGYEYRGPFLFRTFGMVTAGPGGIYPWLGVSLGLSR